MKSLRSISRGARSFAVAIAVGLSVAACAGGAPDDFSEGAGAAGTVVGTWGDTGKSKPHLVLSSDGTMTGNDGCNNISATFAVDGTAITFDPFSTTLKACFGVDTWLSAGHAAEVDGDEMIVTNIDGVQIGTLTRA